MKKENEFRGKRLDNDEWMYGDLMHDNQGGCYIYPLNSLGLFVENKVDPETVGEFLGKKDKNGKKVFEDDIVEVTSLRHGYGDFMKKMLCEIVYDNDLCCFDFRASDRQRCMCATIPDAKIEVIGNIHDNPELLSSK